jgi:hypothetical protein
MKTLFIIIPLFLLAGCPGGFSKPPIAPAVQVTLQPPAPNKTAIIISADNNVIMTDVSFYLVESTIVPNVTVAGGLNEVRFGKDQTSGIVEISGNTNDIIFEPNSTVSYLTVTGINNQLWIPSGSSIVVSNTYPKSTVIHSYTPL